MRAGISARRPLGQMLLRPLASSLALGVSCVIGWLYILALLFSIQVGQQ